MTGIGFTLSELEEIERAAIRRVGREAFLRHHPEYATPVVLSTEQCAAMDEMSDVVEVAAQRKALA